jgi:predicted RNase H-like nuclease (RuvC/YqgF family)
MHSLSRLRPFCRTLSSRQSSQQNKPVDSQEIVQKLINRAEEYRKELRKHIQSSVKHRELAKSITGISKTLNDLEMKRKQLNDIFEAALKPDLVSLEVSTNYIILIRRIL